MRRITNILAILLLIAVVDAQDMVRVDLQVNLFMKILKYDRNLSRRGEGGIKIGVLYNPADKKSTNLATQFENEFNLLSNKTINDIPVFLVTVKGLSELPKAIENYKLNTLYISSGFDDNIGQVMEVCVENKLLTLTAVPKYVEQNGVAVGLGSKKDKPEIIINTNSSKEAGADFSVDILKLSRVIK